MTKPKNASEYIESNNHFSDELIRLRRLICSTELEETIKWGAPVYTLDGKNVIGLAAFKHHFGIWFFNGVFLKDEHNLLINAQENKTKALRQMRFETDQDINENLIIKYINEAIENQKLGKELKPKRITENVVIPQELKLLFDKDWKLGLSFKKLSPGKQREYCSYISEAKRETTKISRLKKITPMIIEGKGLYGKYKNC